MTGFYYTKRQRSCFKNYKTNNSKLSIPLLTQISIDMDVQQLLITGDISAFLSYERNLSDEDRVKRWINASQGEVFTHNYLVHSLNSKYNIIEGITPDKEYIKWLFDYLQNKLDQNTIHSFTRLSFHKCAQIDLAFCVKMEKQLKSEVIHKRVQAYKDFIMQSFDRFEAIDFLESPFNTPNMSLYELVEKEANKTFLTNTGYFVTLETTLRHFDFVQSKLLKNFLKDSSSVIEQKILAKELTKEKFLDNPYLKEYPDRRVDLLKALKTWLLDFIETREKKLGSLATVYAPVYAFISLVESEMEQKVEAVDVKPLQVVPSVLHEKISTESEIKLLTVFNTLNDFKLFDMIAQKATKAVQIIFLYRQMNEKEQPKKIKVKYIQFKEWFETQYCDKDLYLSDKPQNYQQAKSDDRLLLYAILKEVVFREESN